MLHFIQHATLSAAHSLPLLIHILRLQHSFINSTTPYSSKTTGRADWREGCPYWLTDCCIERASWTLQATNEDPKRRWERRKRMSEFDSIKPPFLVHSFIHSSLQPFIYLNRRSFTHLLPVLYSTCCGCFSRYTYKALQWCADLSVHRQ